MPAKEPRGFLMSVLEFLLIFAIFYFAAFKYTTTIDRIIRGIIEFLIVSFSLISAFVIVRIIAELYTRKFEKGFTLRYGHSIIGFLSIYTMGMGILYPIKQGIWNIQKEWFWRYFWRHLPYALLIFGVYLYREYKNSIIDNLVDQLNQKLDTKKAEDTKPVQHVDSESPLQINADGITRSVLPSTISHITVDGHYLDLFFQSDGDFEQICFRKPLKEILEELPAGGFLRTHRSHIVNPAYISGLTKKNRNYSVKLCGDRFQIPISRNNLSRVLAFLESSLSAKN